MYEVANNSSMAVRFPWFQTSSNRRWTSAFAPDDIVFFPRSLVQVMSLVHAEKSSPPLY